MLFPNYSNVIKQKKKKSTFSFFVTSAVREDSFSLHCLVGQGMVDMGAVGTMWWGPKVLLHDAAPRS